MLQAPALEPRAAIREHGDDVARFDADVALRRLADERRRRRGRGGAGAGIAATAERRIRRCRQAWQSPPCRCRPAQTSSRLARSGAGFGTGLTNSACQAYSTRNGEEDGEENASFHLGAAPDRDRRRRAGDTGRGAAPPARPPRTTPWRAIASRRSRRTTAESGRSPLKYGEINDLVASNERQAHRSGGPRWRRLVRGRFGNRLQGRSGWRRAARAWGRRRRRTHGDLVATKNLSNQSFSSISLRPRHRAFCVAAIPSRPTPARVGQDEERAVAAVNSDARARRPAGTRRGGGSVRLGRNPGMSGASSALLAADGQTLAALRAAPLQHEAAVLRAHPHQKPVRPLAMARCWAETCALPCHDIPSEWKSNRQC